MTEDDFKIQAAAGLWAERDDLPDFSEIRKEFVF